jgi:quinol monooxygenase YgiN
VIPRVGERVARITLRGASAFSLVRPQPPGKFKLDIRKQEDPMQIVYAVLTAAPEHREAVIDHAREIAAASREEPGVIDYRVATDVEDPNVLRFVEQYDSEEAVEAHSETEHYEAFAEAVIPDLLASEPEITQFEVTRQVE